MILATCIDSPTGAALQAAAGARGVALRAWQPDRASGARVALLGRPGPAASRAEVRAWLRELGATVEAARDAGSARLVGLSWLGAGRGHSAPMFEAARGLEALLVDGATPYTVVRAGLSPAALRAALPRVGPVGLRPGPGDRPLPLPSPAEVAAALLDALLAPEAAHGVVSLESCAWQRPADLVAPSARVPPPPQPVARTRALRALRALGPWFDDALAGAPVRERAVPRAAPAR